MEPIIYLDYFIESQKSPRRVKLYIIEDYKDNKEAKKYTLSYKRYLKTIRENDK